MSFQVGENDMSDLKRLSFAVLLGGAVLGVPALEQSSKDSDLVGNKVLPNKQSFSSASVRGTKGEVLGVAADPHVRLFMQKNGPPE